MNDFEAVPFPEVIDSTLMAHIKACEVQAIRMYGEHWKPKGESVHLIAGGAFARGLEVTRRLFWDQEYDAETAIALGMPALMEAYGDFEPPDDSAKTLDRMLGAFEYYWASYPLRRQPDEQCDGRPLLTATGKHAIEFSFAEPLPINHPVTGEPLIYSGRTDMIAEFADGLYIWDDKTATQLGARWTGQWDLRSQFTGYTWAARLAGFPIDGVIANGISILKTKYDKARAIVSRGEWEVDRWLDSTVKHLARFIEAWKKGDYLYNLDEACSSYGGCPLKVVCKSPTPQNWLPMYFEKRRWDPLTRTETPLVVEGEILQLDEYAIPAPLPILPSTKVSVS